MEEFNIPKIELTWEKKPSFIPVFAKTAATSFFVSLAILFLFTPPPPFEPIASVRMDGLGYYLVDNYKIEGKCIKFIDHANQPVSFCGAYEVARK